jgi:hypothetical protein
MMVTAGERLAQALMVRRSGRDYLVEQQAYHDSDGPRIVWVEVPCWGYQPVREAAAAL